MSRLPFQVIRLRMGALRRTGAIVRALVLLSFALFFTAAAIGIAQSEEIPQLERWERTYLIVFMASMAAASASISYGHFRNAVVRKPTIVLLPNEIALNHRALFRKTVHIPRDLVRGAVVDATPAKRRFGKERFPIADAESRVPRFLYSPITGCPLPLISNVREVPNVAVLFTRPFVFPHIRWRARSSARFPVRSPVHGKPAHGMLVIVEDPRAAYLTLAEWGVPVRRLAAADAVELIATPAQYRRDRMRRVAALASLALLLNAPAAVALLEGGDGNRPCAEARRLVAETGRETSSGSIERGTLGDRLVESPSGFRPLHPGFETVSAYGVEEWNEESGMLSATRLSGNGFRGGIVGDWTNGSLQLNEQILELETGPDAAALFEETHRAECHEAVEVYDVSEVRGAVGMLLRRDGRPIEIITFVRDNRYYQLTLAGDDGVEPNRALLVDIAAAAERAATAR